MVNTDFEKIEKEEVEKLRFPESEVLTSLELKDKRRSDLDRALSMGNIDQIKIRIYFEDDQSQKFIETTVWGVTDKRVILKQGMVIPIHRIHYLQL
jgi:hypothetical protein